jgi:hypothetical protein
MEERKPTTSRSGQEGLPPKTKSNKRNKDPENFQPASKATKGTKKGTPKKQKKGQN